jgi:hypothetical protein
MFNTEDSKYSAVAIIKAECKNDAYKKSNNIFNSWIENDYVVLAHVDAARSTSVGDIIEEITDSKTDTITKYHKVEMMGFSITNSPYKDLMGGDF